MKTLKKKHSRSFYQEADVLTLSQALLGQFLVTQFPGEPLTAGMIVETEAYRGPEDKASHSYGGRRTQRTETMYAAGGVAYVYLCYGMHHLFNVVTGPKDVPHAVLIRALEPIDGIEHMLLRRKLSKIEKKLTAGPAVLTQALGITTEWDSTSLSGNQIWLEDRGIQIPKHQIVASPRIGVDYADDHAALPWRFYIANNRWVSKTN